MLARLHQHPHERTAFSARQHDRSRGSTQPGMPCIEQGWQCVECLPNKHTNKYACQKKPLTKIQFRIYKQDLHTVRHRAGKPATASVHRASSVQARPTHRLALGWKRASLCRLMSCCVAPVCARSASTSPITDANLKPCPEHAEQRMTCAAGRGCRGAVRERAARRCVAAPRGGTWGCLGCASIMKCESGVLVNVHTHACFISPSAPGKNRATAARSTCRGRVQVSLVRAGATLRSSCSLEAMSALSCVTLSAASVRSAQTQMPSPDTREHA